jgi:uncharacterized RDD family membrane protein YckC
VAQQQQPATGAWQPVAPSRDAAAAEIVYAGFWIRVVAWFIDAVAIGILTSAFAPMSGAGTFVGPDGARLDNYGANAVGGLVGLVYFVGLWAWKGQTLGMMPFGLWVVCEEDGERPDAVRAFLRYVGLIISFAVLLLGVIWVAFDREKQGWHDKIAKTVVVRRPR